MSEKKSYLVTIEETVSESFQFEAETDLEAEMIIKEKYKAGNIILPPGNLTNKQIQICNITDDYSTEWVEF